MEICMAAMAQGSAAAGGGVPGQLIVRIELYDSHPAVEGDDGRRRTPRLD